MGLNLFSMFDPSANCGLSLNWLALMAGVVFLPSLKSLSPARVFSLWKMAIVGLLAEMRPLFNSFSVSSGVVFVALFYFIMSMNLSGLLPFVFTPTSHLAVTLSLALPLWWGYFAYSWGMNFKHSLAHLVPPGTPLLLMPLMVLIESVSSLIRPGTLSLRLAANMVAGHMLLGLMSGAISLSSGVAGIITLLSQIGLVTLEVAVAVIQAYVLVVLSALYASEA